MNVADCGPVQEHWGLRWDGNPYHPCSRVTDVRSLPAIGKNSMLRAAGWVETNQHASDREALNERGLCPSDRFQTLVQFRVVDMNHIPGDLRNFDFVWSSCSLEHLGSIEHGEQFIYNAMKCLKPGGIAVHTTEYSVSSNRFTIRRGDSVLFRRRDIERVARTLSAGGHHLELDFTDGDLPLDRVVGVPPYRNEPHLKLLISRYVSTSLGLIIRKNPAP